jgi:putative flippase GtrA
MRYIIAGSIGAFINLVSMYVLTSVLGVWYLLSSIFAFSASLLVTFFIQKVWTFGDKKFQVRHATKQALFYTTSSCGTCLPNLFL